MDDASRGEALRLRAILRAEQSAPLVSQIRTWAHRQRALPESRLGKAIAYMLGLWPSLTRFLDDPRIPLDNNASSPRSFAGSSRRRTCSRRPAPPSPIL